MQNAECIMQNKMTTTASPKMGDGRCFLPGVLRGSNFRLQHMADVVQLGIVAIGHGLQKQLDDLLHVLKTPFVSIGGLAHLRGIYGIGVDAEWAACFISACQSTSVDRWGYLTRWI